MILVPFPNFIKVKNFIVTLALGLILIAVHLLVVHFEVSKPEISMLKAESEFFYNVQSKLYLNFLKEQNSHLNQQQRVIASLQSSDIDKRLLTRASLQDAYFDPLTAPQSGIDQVEYKHWKQTYFRITEASALSSASLLGVNLTHAPWTDWLTYMFVHIGFYHLLSNVIFLVLFGALIESLFGGLMVIVLFLGSGLVAIPVHLLLSGASTSSLVGASGGVCGLVAFYSVYKFKSPLRFFYWVLPIENYYGFVQLFSGVILFLWFLSDLAGYLGGVPFLENIAHTAHLGGFLAGSTAALAVLIFQKYFPQQSSLHLQAAMDSTTN